MVRTDAREQKLDAFVVPKSLQLAAVPETVADTPSLLPSTEGMCSPQEEEKEEGTGGAEEEEGMELEEKRENKVEPSEVAKHQESEDKDSNYRGTDRKIVRESTEIDSSSSTKTSSSTPSKPLSAEK